MSRTTLKTLWEPVLSRNKTPRRKKRGFTLIELLVVMAITGLLAALLLPVLSAARARSSQIRCVNNLKQLSLCAQMYSADNAGRLVVNQPQAALTNVWVPGNMESQSDATNQFLIRAGKLFPYASQVSLYRCPADPSRAQGLPRVRSYSMNGWFGSRNMENLYQSSGSKMYRTFIKESEVAAAGPATLWVIADEHEKTIDDAWFLVTMDDSRPFASLPAFRHDRGYALNFADGHVQVNKLRDPGTTFAGAGRYIQVSPRNEDWIRFKQITTTR